MSKSYQAKSRLVVKLIFSRVPRCRLVAGEISMIEIIFLDDNCCYTAAKFSFAVVSLSKQLLKIFEFVPG
jgi:hypothetical protein